MGCWPNEIICFTTLAGVGTGGWSWGSNTNPKEAVSDIEGMETHSSGMGVWMSSPEKKCPFTK